MKVKTALSIVGISLTILGWLIYWLKLMGW